MRVKSREHLNSRSEFIRRCGWMVVSTSSFLALAACGGGGGGSDSPSAPVNPPATPSNTAPSANAGEDKAIEWPTSTTQHAGTGTDAESQSTLTYAWSATGGPTGVTFSASNAASTNATFPGPGTYQLTLTVSDGSLTATDTTSVTVSPAVYPASDATNQDTTNHGWARVTASTDVGMTQQGLVDAQTYAQSQDSASISPTIPSAGMVVRRGRIVHSWGDIDRRFDMKSTSKSIGGISLGLAVNDGLLQLGDTAVSKYGSFGANPPSNVSTGYIGNITIQQLATHTAGFVKTAAYFPASNPTAPTIVYQPGTTWSYSDGGLNWLSEVLTTVYNQDLATVMGTRVWTALGVNSSFGGTQNSDAAPGSDVHWRNNVSRPNPVPGSMEKRELASGIYANVNAMARVGLLFLRKGAWGEQQILQPGFVDTVSKPVAANATLTNPDEPNFPQATTNYGVLWWTNATGMMPNVPRDTYWAWGLGDSLIVVIPSLDLVIVRAGAQASADTAGRTWNDFDWNGNYSVLEPFLNPIVGAVTQ